MEIMYLTGDKKGTTAVVNEEAGDSLLCNNEARLLSYREINKIVELSSKNFKINKAVLV